MKLRVLFVATALSLAGAAHSQDAPKVSPDQLGAVGWRSIGPFRGGRVLAVEGVPGRPQEFFFGAVNGGVWKTGDAGRTWTPVFDAAPVASIGDLAIAPSQPDTIYVGTGEADMRSDIAQGQGLYKSTDSGRSWSFIGLADTQQIGRIIVDPTNPDVVLTAALGHPYGPNAERGVFRSADGGKTWTRTLFRNADTGAVDLAFQPGNPHVVYAALWQTRRPPWNVYPPSSGPGGGLWKSSDGGVTWRQLSAGLPKATGRIGIGVSPADPKRLYALIDATGGAGGLYRSDDEGATWSHVSDDRRIYNRGWYFSGVTVDPKNADVVHVADTIMLRSDDGGRHFAPYKGDPTGDDYHRLWIDPQNPNRRILGVDQGTLVTLNGGKTWSSWFNQPTGQFYHVVTDNRFPYRVYGAQQDSGAAGVPSRTDSGTDGINMTQFHEITAGGESDNIAPDPDDPDLVFGGRVDRLDLKTGQTRSVDPTFAFPDNYRGTWTLPLVFGKADHALYFGNQRVFRTSDRGQHWTPISPDLTRETPGSPANLDAPTVADDSHLSARKGVVYAIGPSPLDAGTIWAGTDDGLVWRTTNGGETWTNVTPPGLTAWSKIGIVDAGHFDARTAYIAVDRHRLDDFKAYVYRTHDGGAHWTRISRGLEDGGALNAVNVVREDPRVAGLLYAGTERGVFVSFDDGDHWQPLQHGLPVTSVRDIEVKDNDLVIATHGRGFYVMDDIGSLRALKTDASRGTRLLPPSTAIRMRVSAFTGTPMPKDEPMAQNPSNGADLDYQIGSPPKGPIELVIRDAAGAEVRRYRSDTPQPPLDLAKLAVAPEWVETPPRLDARPGVHRMVWDFHYAAQRKGDDNGVWAPPGRYTADLVVDGQTFSQGFELRPDPRVTATSADYVGSFQLARRIEALQARVDAAIDATKALHGKVKGAPPARRKRLDALEARLVDIADIEVEPDPNVTIPAPPRHTEGLRFLAAKLATLRGAVDDADGPPSADAQTGAAQAEAQLTSTLARWDRARADLEAALSG